MQIKEAEIILNSMTENASLKRHALSVALVMRAYAELHSEDATEWYVTGLLHDADYEKWPEEHPNRIVKLLSEKGENRIAHAISAHYTHWGMAYDTLLDKALIACDELTGFIIACCQVRPDGIATLETNSVKKKLKSKGFAASVDRNEIDAGCQLLGVTLDDHIGFIIKVLNQHKEELGV